MSSDARVKILKAVNHIEDKSITDLQSHITRTKHQLAELRKGDLNSLSQFVFGISISPEGYVVDPGNNFNKHLHGIYTQHMISMSAMESKIKKDAPDIYDEASLDIRIIRNTLDKVYKHLNQLFVLQETLTQPLLADQETTMSLEQSEDLNTFQILILDILNDLEREKLRKVRDMVCSEVLTPEGIRTMSWEPECTIIEKIHTMCDKNSNPDRWKNFTKRSSMAKELGTYLENCADVQFPEVVKNRHAWSFKNGVFVGDMKGNRFYPYSSEKFGELDRNMVTSKYFDIEFNDCTTSNWRDVETPLLDSIMDYQGWDKDVKRWMYIMLGRLTFDLNEADTWQVIPFCKGIAQSGKSTLLNYVTKMFYVPSEVSVMANNIEEKFGLSSIYQSRVFIGPEIRSDFRIEQAEFQSLISGEEIQIARKGKTAVTVQWNVPGILAGNETPSFADNSGSILRRLIVFKFPKQVMKGDARLGAKLGGEIDRILQKSIAAYKEAVDEYSDKLIWDIVPNTFKMWSKEIQGQLHTLIGFMETPQIVYGTDLKVPLNVLRNAYKQYCTNIGVRSRPWKLELYEGPFSQRDINIVVEDINWNGTLLKNREVVVGMTLEEYKD